MKEAQVNAEMISKYFIALKDLKNEIERTGGEVSINEFCKDRKLNNNLTAILKNGGIIQNMNGNERRPIYEWISIDPTVKMARETIMRLREKNRVQMERSKENREAKKLEATMSQNKHDEQIETSQKKSTEKIEIVLESEAIKEPYKDDSEAFQNHAKEGEKDVRFKFSVLYGLFVIEYTKEGRSEI